jgi:hypothetical protein
MKKKLSFATKFVLRILVIAIVVNTIVSSAQLLHDKDFLFADLLQVVSLTLRLSLLVFVIVGALLFLITLGAEIGKEKTFWLLMTSGLLFTTIAYTLFDEQFLKYTDELWAIPAIAAFAALVSIASQYEFFHHLDYRADQAPITKA